MDESPGTFRTTEGVTLHAAWCDEENYPGSFYDWPYDPNGGEGSMASAVVDEQATMLVDACTFTRPGYTFVRWLTPPDGSGVSFLLGYRCFVASWSQPLYAIWQEGAAEDEPSGGSMHQLHNEWAGEHFYTSDDEEFAGLVALG